MIRIGDCEIDNGSPVFIIAEAGVNHNGDINLAKKLIDKAAWAGADAVKFQTFRTEKLVTEYADMAKYQKDNLSCEDSQFNMLKKLELNFQDFVQLKNYSMKKGIKFLSTPFDFDSAEILNSIGMEAFKISSADLTNIPFLEYIAKFNKPIILSSGMATLADIEEALTAINGCGNCKIAVLHCTSNYPANVENVNLKAVNTIKDAFKVVSGYSDHTEGITIPIASASMGAAIIEKHFTLDRNMEGPDHKASLEPCQLKEMISQIRNIEKAMGNGIKMYSHSEIDTMKAARKSIVVSRNIEAGEIIKFEDLDFKRPGTGLMPKFYKEIIGMRAVKNIIKDEQISFDLVRKS